MVRTKLARGRRTWATKPVVTFQFNEICCPDVENVRGRTGILLHRYRFDRVPGMVPESS